eukprot:662212-Amphidinium_carterae.1
MVISVRPIDYIHLVQLFFLHQLVLQNATEYVTGNATWLISAVRGEKYRSNTPQQEDVNG